MPVRWMSRGDGAARPRGHSGVSASVANGENLLQLAKVRGDFTGPIKEDWLKTYGVNECLLKYPVFNKGGGVEVVHNTSPELVEKANKLTGELMEKLQSNGIFYLHQLEALSMHGQLNDVLDCVGVSNKITETFEKLVAMERREHAFMSFMMSLSGSLASMEAMCVNYGLAAALVLTMTFANFGSVTSEDWIEYLKRVEIHTMHCQKLARIDCEPTGMIPAPNTLLDYSRPAYCMDALNEFSEDYATNLNGTELECCINTVKCIVDSSFKTEMAFTWGNGGSTAVLLLVTLFTSWLYITLNATKANTSRWAESKLLSDRLRQEFLILHALFAFGMVLAFIGMGSVMRVKVTTYGMSWVVNCIVLLASLITTGFAIKCLWEINQVNKAVDEMRTDSLDPSEQSMSPKPIKRQQTRSNNSASARSKHSDSGAGISSQRQNSADL